MRVVAKVHLGDGTERACRLGLTEEKNKTNRGNTYTIHSEWPEGC